DVVAHEASHGLIENTAGLLYVYEPGIINEAIADIFACLVELAQGGGNWVLGEDVVPGGERRLDAPHLMGLPDTYLGDFWRPQAAPGQALHHNSTVLGHWFYLLAEGGTGVNDLGTPYSVSAMGRNKAAELLFHAMRYFLNPNDGFFGLRRATMAAAGTAGLNWNQVEVDNLAMAWCAVGVGGCQEMGNDTVTLLSPNGGEQYYPGDPMTVEWENTFGVTHLKVLFSANGGASWQELESFQVFGTSGSKLVNAPNVNSRLCRIRVAAENEPLAFDDSDSTFHIIGCSLLSGFTVLPESGCPGTSFVIDNTSLSQDAGFSWRVNGQPYPAAPGGFTLLALEPGLHTITLIADDNVCIDTFCRVIQVAPAPAAAFNVSVSNRVVTAAAAFPDGEQYFWSANGQALPLFNGSLSMAWTAPYTGTFEVCLFVGDNCSFGGEQACQEVVVSEPVSCEGEDEEWTTIGFTEYAQKMAEDGDFLWIITGAGLVKFSKIDGSFIVYNKTNFGLPCLDLSAITVTPDGRKILGTHGHGLAAFYGNGENPSDWEYFTTQNSRWLPSNLIRELATDNAGNVWITSEKVYMWDGDTTTQRKLQENYVEVLYPYENSMFVSRPGKLFRISEQGEVDTINIDNFPHIHIQALTKDTYGNLWAGTVSGLVKMDSSYQIQAVYDNETPNLPNGNILSLAQGENGQVWVGTSNGAALFDGVSSFTSFDLVSPAWNDPRFFCFIKKDSSSIWAGTDEGLFKKTGTSWEHFSLSSNNLIGEHVSSITYDEYTGEILLYNHNSFFRITDSTWIPFSCNSPSNNPEIEIDSNGDVWISNPLRRFHPPTGNCHDAYDDLNFPGTSALSRPIEIWGNFVCSADSRGNLYLWDIENEEWMTISAVLSQEYARDMAVTPNQSLWVVGGSDTLVEIKENMQP
ncbi:MAG: M4 family metallopeptidase, partial [Phaeodactylibacter sp.]|nr:M4 family metallopeptidase [Phaeodactylibacter sp.]